ncbi:hypothetical protein F442_00416 [Phytophthora nicotianae P10297]|uniref:Uncharacterized protein n=2 Tax=Phytophthora nicotianae TaxID=4792 RepID=W3A8X3_PHYNI|nr:hypothetical protein F444_00419 [Phytophthora nicotianae P1976]ETP54984.1 hypothetical protein F442_00416 [Phytophthora nicotianae P10297]
MAEADTALIILFAAGPPQPPHASAGYVEVFKQIVFIRGLLLIAAFLP